MKSHKMIGMSALFAALLGTTSGCDEGNHNVQGSQASEAEQGQSASIENATRSFKMLRNAKPSKELQDDPSINPIASFEGTIVEIERDMSGWYLLLVDPLAREGMNVWISPANLPEDSNFDPAWLKIGNKLSVEGWLRSGSFGEVIVVRDVQGEDSGSEPTEVVIEDNFNRSNDGWKPFFAEYNPRFADQYKLDSSLSGLPGNLNRRDGAFRITGTNHSDDLFMALYKKVDGLKPGASYQVHMRAEIASDAFKDAVGVGGSPGQSVYVKMGAISKEPHRLFRGDLVHVNFDKGNQSNSGADMRVVGNVEISTTQQGVWELIDRNNYDQPQQVRANEDGEIWLLIGTDSGFESTTTLYYNSIHAEIRPLR